MPKPPAKQYRTKNWKAYNAGLKSRGSLSIWLDKEMTWFAGDTGKRRRAPTYGDTAIQFCLSLKCLFGLPRRQSMGLVESLLKLSGLAWPVIDAQTLEIRAIEVTSNSVGDPPMLPELLDQIATPIATVSGDGAYDTKACHADIIPPRKNARLWKKYPPGAETRNEIVKATQRLGRAIWKKWSRYHRRSLGETKIRCLKLLGERIMARDFESPSRRTSRTSRVAQSFHSTRHPRYGGYAINPPGVRGNSTLR